MKNIFFNIIFLFTALILKAKQEAGKDEFVLSGKASGLDDKFIYIFYNDAKGNNVRDSVLVKNGSFRIKGNIAEPTIATLTSVSTPGWSSNGKDISPLLFLEPLSMNVIINEGNMKDLKLSGSKTQNEELQLEQQKTVIYKTLEPYNAAYNKLNEEYINLVKAKAGEESLKPLSDKMDSIRTLEEPFQAKIAKVDKAFFKENPGSYVTAYMLRYYVSSLSVNELKNYYSKMPSQVQQSKFGKEVNEEIKKLISGSPGSLAPAFAAKDLKGDSLKLADFKGRYVLLDFWASWCGPCRKGNPHLIELYKKYKGKRVEFIGVSDDDGTEDKWKEAIAKDGTGIWKHILRGLKFDKKNSPGFTNDISSKYGIHTLPTKILIDPNGVIIGRYGNEEEDHAAMDKKLAEVLKG